MNKQRLFEVMGYLDNTFKSTTNENNLQYMKADQQYSHYTGTQRMNIVDSTYLLLNPNEDVDADMFSNVLLENISKLEQIIKHLDGIKGLNVFDMVEPLIIGMRENATLLIKNLNNVDNQKYGNEINNNLNKLNGEIGRIDQEHNFG